jgi:hypothetical protein
MRRDDALPSPQKGTEESASKNFSVCLANVTTSFLVQLGPGGDCSSPVWGKEGSDRITEPSAQLFRVAGIYARPKRMSRTNLRARSALCTACSIPFAPAGPLYPTARTFYSNRSKQRGQLKGWPLVKGRTIRRIVFAYGAQVSLTE